MPLPPPIDPADLERFVGMSFSDFTEQLADQGVVCRVVVIDGVPQAATLDYSPRRVNVAVVGDEQLVVAIEGIG